MTKKQIIASIEERLTRMHIKPLKLVADQITGKKYAICRMETSDPNETRVAQHISNYRTPEELQVFLDGWDMGRHYTILMR